MAASGHFEKVSKLSFDLKWRKMQSKINFGHPKWQPKSKFCFDLKWAEMQEKPVSFRTFIYKTAPSVQAK
jgi:hypothetical protein